MMKKVYILLTGILFWLQAFPQSDGNHANPEVPNGRKATGRLYGKIVDSKTNKGIEAVSLQLFFILTGRSAVPLPDSTAVVQKDSLAGGMLTKPNGDFSIDNLPVNARYKLVISAIGYQPLERTVSFAVKGGREGGAIEQDLGNIKVEQESQYLNSVTVVGQKPALTMGIDRKTFDVEKNLTSAGGTAIDVMKNIPSVTVDVDGNVALRNRAPQIFVDGRPTILTLDQIPADNIEKIELITNPSAQFDASSMGGVINIVLKKNRKLGLNGLVSAGLGYPDIYTGGINLNLRENKFNFFVSGNYNQQGGKAKGESYRINKENGVVQDYFNQYSNTDRMRRFGNIRLGVDYFLDNRNTLTLAQSFVTGTFTNDQTQNQEYFTIDKILDHTGKRVSEGTSEFNRNNSQVIFKHKFAEPGKELNADVNFSWGTSNDRDNILNAYFKPDGSAYAPDNRVRNDGSSDNNQVTIQVDFVDPKGEKSKLETGVRSYINNYTSLFNAFSLGTNTETKLPLSNHYKYREQVHAGYVTYTDKLGSIGYQLGLRAEYSKFDGNLIDSSRTFGYEYPNSSSNLFNALFPSVFLSKEIGEGQEIQLNYTRRVRRPNFWQLNPFVDIQDPLNLRQGNPELKPEFTNSFEFNYSKTYSTGNFLGVLYYSRSTDEMTQYSDTITDAQYQQLNNAAVDPNAILNTFINANSENQWGAELTLQQRFGKNFDITPTINLNYTKVDAKVKNLDLSNEGFNWESKLIANYRISSKSPIINKLGIQMIGEYESPEILPQGKRKEQYSVDMALRKDFLKDNKGTLTFSVNDVFNTNRWGTIYDTPEFYQDSYRRRNVRSFRLTFTYKFGKSDFNLFKRQRSEHSNGGEEMERP